MPRLGTHGRPAVVRVQTEERALEILELCDRHGWQLIVGIEDDQPEDVTDIQKLLNPQLFAARRQVLAGRNDPCPCGSGRKYKKCCLGAPSSAA